ncbi:hypothetical protein EDD85DRAFT_792862 [Armillaria nabsnona]|nr:hypothetical protein EDD85DRAFT_792862 [Armillaria nabsnona]
MHKVLRSPRAIDAESQLEWHDHPVRCRVCPPILEDHAKSLLDFREASEQEIHIAKQEAEHQVFVLFKYPRRKNQVAAILIACSGMWRMWKVARRFVRSAPRKLESTKSTNATGMRSSVTSDEQSLPVPSTAFAQAEEDQDDVGPPPDGSRQTDKLTLTMLTTTRGSVLSEKRRLSPAHDPEEHSAHDSTNKRPKLISKLEGRQRDSRAEDSNGNESDTASSTILIQDLGESQGEPLYENVEDAWPLQGKWSKAIYLGSPASNQRMLLIHQWLQTFRQECISRPM